VNYVEHTGHLVGGTGTCQRAAAWLHCHHFSLRGEGDHCWPVFAFVVAPALSLAYDNAACLSASCLHPLPIDVQRVYLPGQALYVRAAWFWDLISGLPGHNIVQDHTHLGNRALG